MPTIEKKQFCKGAIRKLHGPIIREGEVHEVYKSYCVKWSTRGRVGLGIGKKVESLVHEVF